MSYSVSWYRTPVDPRVRAHFFNTRVVNSKYISYITDKGNYIYMAGLKEGNTEVTYINRNLIKDRLLCPWNSSGKNTGVGCHSLLQGILPDPGVESCLLNCRQTFYSLSHQGSSSSSLCTEQRTFRTWPHPVIPLIPSLLHHIQWILAVSTDTYCPFYLEGPGKPSSFTIQSEYQLLCETVS